MKEEVRWLIGIGVLLAGLILNFQRVNGNRIERVEDALNEHRVEATMEFDRLWESLSEHRAETAMQSDRLWDALNEHKAETAMNFNRLEEVLTGHRVEAAREFGEIRSSLEFLLPGDPPGGQ